MNIFFEADTSQGKKQVCPDLVTALMFQIRLPYSSWLWLGNSRSRADLIASIDVRSMPSFLKRWYLLEQTDISRRFYEILCPRSSPAPEDSFCIVIQGCFSVVSRRFYPTEMYIMSQSLLSYYWIDTLSPSASTILRVLPIAQMRYDHSSSLAVCGFNFPLIAFVVRK